MNVLSVSRASRNVSWPPPDGGRRIEAPLPQLLAEQQPVLGRGDDDEGVSRHQTGAQELGHHARPAPRPGRRTGRCARGPSSALARGPRPAPRGAGVSGRAPPPVAWGSRRRSSRLAVGVIGPPSRILEPDVDVYFPPRAASGWRKKARRRALKPPGALRVRPCPDRGRLPGAGPCRIGPTSTRVETHRGLRADW